MMTLMYMLAIF